MNERERLELYKKLKQCESLVDEALCILTDIQLDARQCELLSALSKFDNMQLIEDIDNVRRYLSGNMSAVRSSLMERVY